MDTWLASSCGFLVMTLCQGILTTPSWPTCTSWAGGWTVARDRHTITRAVPHYNSIFNYLENPILRPILRGLIIESSLPLKVVEADFAVDSSGFTTSRFIRWFDHKYGVVRQQHEWVKVHLMCGVKTNVVTAVEIREKDASDTKLLPDLVHTT